MNLLCSWGGVGTTFFLEYLEEIENYPGNPARGYLNPLKHPLAPPKLAAERAVFLFGCPYLSIISLFRRSYDALHYVNINGLFPAQQPFPQGDLWLATCQRFELQEVRPGVWVGPDGRYADDLGALEWLRVRKQERAEALSTVAAIARASYQDFDDFLTRGVDLFRRQEQWNNWKKGAGYPILLVRYETLWSHKERVLSFLQVPPREWSRFPAQKTRCSSIQDLTPEQLEKLKTLYGPLAEEIAATPDLVEVSARSS